MSVGLLIITHDGIGPSVLGTATLMLNACPLPVKLLSVSHDSDPEDLADHAKALITELNEGDGVLILTDVIGATPSNVARQLLGQADVCLVGGLNLPMLMRVLNYPDLAIGELAQKAVSGGKEGVIRAEKT